MTDFNLADALTTTGLGMFIVFAVLVFLMFVISLMAKLIKGKKAAPAASTDAPAPVPAPPPAAPAGDVARGSCGDVKLFDVPDKTAAMLMAIAADKLEAPLAELRFISIKEVK